MTTILAATLGLSLSGCIRVVDNDIRESGHQESGKMSDADRMAREDGIPVHGETPGKTCTTDGLSGYVGKPATSEIGDAIVRAANAANLRWIRPDTAVTMDFRPDRINVKIDHANVITGFTCG